MKFDYIVVGAGITGSVIARSLSDSGCKVQLLERRAVISGNLHSYTHPSGIDIHTYGPHLFRTDSEEIWNYVNRFSKFYKYEHTVTSYVDEKYEHWPICEDYIRRNIGENWEPAFKGIPENFEDMSLSMMPRIVYEKFVKDYTEKQWGVPARNLSVGLAGRFSVHKDNDVRLKSCKYQALPANGYTKFVENIIEDIPVRVNFDYLKNRDIVKPNKMLVFTGPIDEFFGFRFGHLFYRGQKRDIAYMPDIDYRWPSPVVNFPSKKYPYVRITEWKRMMEKEAAKKVTGTVTTTETPYTPSNSDGYEYPMPDSVNQNLYLRYKAIADAIPGLLICGRLGEYKYYDIDQAIERALMIADKIITENK